MPKATFTTGQRAAFSIQRFTHFTICLCIALILLYIGASFFIPIVYGVFFAFLLKPLCDRIESIVRGRVLAILLTFLTVFLTIGGVITFFIVEIFEVVSEADGIMTSLRDSVLEVVNSFAALFGMGEREVFVMISDSVSNLTEAPIGLLTAGLSTSGEMLANFFLIVIYTFFFLLYSTALKRFTLGQMRGRIKLEGEATIREVQGVASNYLGGMLTVMLILGVLNSLGLYLIGVRFALVWGFLGALLAIIPYVGTFIGGLLPFLYSVATLDSFWQPIAVILLYIGVQSLEGNLITPKVVGNSVKINALAAVISLLFGALFWGIAGVILAIPLLAMVRVVLNHIDVTKPLALLLSDDLYNNSDKFDNEYNKDKYRLRTLFKTQDRRVVSVRPQSEQKPADAVGQADPEIVADTETK